jgi:hypothetical protein
MKRLRKLMVHFGTFGQCKLSAHHERIKNGILNA